MPVKAEPNDEVTERVYSSGSGMRQERLPAAGRRPRAGVKQRQQSSGGVGNIISSVLKKRNGISRSAPRLLCTLEPGDLRVYGLILNICRQSSAKKRDTCQNTTKCWAEISNNINKVHAVVGDFGSCGCSNF